jgi:glycosyltransferase involved in cell wall biosynthesis
MERSVQHMPSSGAPSVTFFIPCLNEQGNVGRAIDKVLQIMDGLDHPFEMLVVDDASTDGSVAEVQERQRRYPDAAIRLIRNRFTRGLGTNYFIAAQQASGEYFILMCGDAIEEVRCIREILSHLGEADAIVPYVRDTRPLWRRALSQAFTRLVNLFSGHRLRYYNGCVLHRTENIRTWFGRSTGFGYQAELLCLMLDQGMTVYEMEIYNHERTRQGVTKAFRPRNIISVLLTLVRVFVRHRIAGPPIVPEPPAAPAAPPPAPAPAAERAAEDEGIRVG